MEKKDSRMTNPTPTHYVWRLWRLGKMRIFCGDFARHADAERAQKQLVRIWKCSFQIEYTGKYLGADDR